MQNVVLKGPLLHPLYVKKKKNAKCSHLSIHSCKMELTGIISMVEVQRKELSNKQVVVV
jgi:hypothetical protein